MCLYYYIISKKINNSVLGSARLYRNSAKCGGVVGFLVIFHEPLDIYYGMFEDFGTAFKICGSAELYVIQNIRCNDALKSRMHRWHHELVGRPDF